MKKKKIYYWASNDVDNNGEGILAKNFLLLVKENFKSYRLIPINKSKKLNQNSNFYKYIIPFWGILKLWKYYILGNKIAYVNFLPAWNFLIFILLPKNVILGPVTGSINRVRHKIIISFLSSFGIKILKIKFNRVLFSHDFFSKYLDENSKKYFFNFLLYGFKIKKFKRKKIYDLIFYIKKHENKKNDFLFKIIKELSNEYKICIIGERIKNIKNVYNKGFVSRKKALELINLSKASLASYENLFSYFVLDSLKYRLITFYNKDFKPNKNVKTDLMTPIDYNDPKKSVKIIKEKLKKKVNRKIFVKNIDFNSFFKIP